MNGQGIEVEVDRAALLAEAAAVGATDSSPQGGVDGLPPGTAAAVPGGVASDPQQRAADVLPTVVMAIDAIADNFAPNWHVTKDERDKVSQSTALVLAYWMPDATLEPKYASALMLASALWGIARDRRDPETGKYKPLKVPVKKADKSDKAPVTSEETPVAPVERAPLVL